MNDMFSNTTVLILISLLLIITIVNSHRRWIIYKKIRRTGTHGFGRLISCDRDLFVYRGIAIIPRYSPIIEFYYAEKRYEMRAMGHFGVRPGKVGDEIAIIFSEEHPDKVVIVNRHILDSHIAEILLYLTLGAVIFTILYLLT